MAEPIIYRVPDPDPKKNESVMLRFEWHTEKNDEFTEALGVPSFDTLLIGFVSAPGQMRSEANVIIERKLPDGTVRVNQHAYQRFQQYVDSFKRGEAGEGLSGTPLEELTSIDHAMRSTLRALGIHSVEGLAEMAETAAGTFMGFRKYKSLAQSFLEARKGEAPMLKLAAELEARDKEIAVLKSNNADLLARVEAIEAAQKESEKASEPKRKVA